MNGSKIRIGLGTLAGIAIAVFLLAPGESHPQGQALQPQLEGPELIEALRKGGLVILMRHMSTDSYVPGEGAHDDQDCASQRNLDEQGRQAAKDVGVAFKSLNIPVGTVLTSPYCRCVDTGKLAFGKGTPSQDLAVFDELPAPEKEAMGKLIRKLLNTAPADGRNTVMITHTGTLLYSFGLQTRPEGIAHVFRPAEFGNAIYLGRVDPEEWSALASSMGAGS
ncbi:MAG: histidine phosphatase family protein [Deltaproteobacteria bacterium]|nr:histidine phosphatase family protein [Deltaproteobacteria bacterium]